MPTREKQIADCAIAIQLTRKNYTEAIRDEDAAFDAFLERRKYSAHCRLQLSQLKESLVALGEAKCQQEKKSTAT